MYVLCVCIGRIKHHTVSDCEDGGRTASISGTAEYTRVGTYHHVKIFRLSVFTMHGRP